LPPLPPLPMAPSSTSSSSLAPPAPWGSPGLRLGEPPAPAALPPFMFPAPNSSAVVALGPPEPVGSESSVGLVSGGMSEPVLPGPDPLAPPPVTSSFVAAVAGIVGSALPDGFAALPPTAVLPAGLLLLPFGLGVTMASPVESPSLCSSVQATRAQV